MPDEPNGDLVSISKADLATLQKSYGLLNKLWDDPNHGAAVKRAAKTIDPSLRIPEIDVAEPLLKPLNEKLAALEAKDTERDAVIAALKQEREDEKAVEKLGKTLGAAQKRYRLTDEAMTEVKKRMMETGNPDPMSAAAYIVSEIEPAKVVNGSNFAPQDLNVFGMDGAAEDDSTKRLHNDPMKWLDRAVPEIMAEFDQDQAA